MSKDEKIKDLQAKVDFYKWYSNMWRDSSMKHLQDWGKALDDKYKLVKENRNLRVEISKLKHYPEWRDKEEEGKILVDKEELQEFNAQFLELLWRYQDYTELQESTEELEKFKKWMERVEEKLDRFSYRLD